MWKQWYSQQRFFHYCQSTKLTSFFNTCFTKLWWVSCNIWPIKSNKMQDFTSHNLKRNLENACLHLHISLAFNCFYNRRKNVKMIWKTLLIGLSTTNFIVRGLIWILNGKTIRFALQTQLETSIHLLMMDSGSKRVTFLKSRETTSPRPSSRLLNPIINPSYFSLHVNGQTNRPHLLWLIILFQITTWCSTL